MFPHFHIFDFLSLSFYLHVLSIIPLLWMNHQLIATHKLWVMGTFMDKFEGTNYMLWQFMMEMMLR
jgi:hypothetical protein